MEKRHFTIENSGIKIPAVMWGHSSPRLLLAVHGIQSSKEDAVIALAAEKAAEKGFCTLSFDLPEHGSRACETGYPCNPWNGQRDLIALYNYASGISDDISIFACSLGAYLTLLALPEIRIGRLLLLSPVVNMMHIIENMMQNAGVSEERLKKEKVIPVPGGQPLDWEYTCYVKEHPVVCDCSHRVSILYGENDGLCSYEDVAEFSQRFSADLTALPGGEHWFHTENQLSALSSWLEKELDFPDAALLISRLTAKDNSLGCQSAELLARANENHDICSPYLTEIMTLLDNKNSLVRNRALMLAASCAKWDGEKKLDPFLEGLLQHITDEKPITSRQCIKALVHIATEKPYLSDRIVTALRAADISRYNDSMRPLVEKDISQALKKLDAFKEKKE